MACQHRSVGRAFSLGWLSRHDGHEAKISDSESIAYQDIILNQQGEWRPVDSRKPVSSGRGDQWTSRFGAVRKVPRGYLHRLTSQVSPKEGMVASWYCRVLLEPEQFIFEVASSWSRCRFYASPSTLLGKRPGFSNGKEYKSIRLGYVYVFCE